MAQDVSGFGITVALTASVTFPSGIVITQFSNDTDPLDLASVKIGDVAMGLNGDLITWAKAIALPMVLNVIPGSPDDQNLQILAENNRVGQGKISAYDVIAAVVSYPDGSSVALSQGKITDASFGKSVAAEGRIKTKSYSFQFQNDTVTPAS